MNKKLIAVAVASAFGIPSLALAQFSVPDGVAGSSTAGSNVTIGGKLNFIGGYYHNGGSGLDLPTTPTGAQAVGSKGLRSTDSINNSESQLDIKGAEALGGGLSAWFQCGSSLDLLGNGAAKGTAGLCGRNSGIGMKGNFGNAYIGNWDTSQKMGIAPFVLFSQSYPIGNGALFNNSDSAATTNVDVASTASAFGTSVGATNFWRRQSRLMTYITPVIAGFQASAGLSAGNESTGLTNGSSVNKPRMYSFGANYTNGPVMLGVGVESHKGYNPAGTKVLAIAANTAATGNTYAGGTDTIWNLAGKYSFGNAGFVNAIYSAISYQINGNLNTTQNNWTINGQWNLGGPHAIKLGYINLGTTGGTYGGGTANNAFAPTSLGQMTANGGAGNTGAKMYQFEYVYAFSKRTEVGVMYKQVKNDSQANYTSGTGSTLGAYGEAVDYMGLRLSHSF